MAEDKLRKILLKLIEDVDLCNNYEEVGTCIDMTKDKILKLLEGRV